MSLGEGSTSLGVRSSSWCSWPKITESLVPLDYLSWSTEVYLLISSHEGEALLPTKKSTVLAANCKLVREQQSTRSTARPGASNNQESAMDKGPALTTAEDWPPMYWSQLCDMRLISSTQYALLSCVEWVKTRPTMAIRCWSPKPNSH